MAFYHFRRSPKKRTSPSAYQMSRKGGMIRIPSAQNALSSSARPEQSCSYNANARRAAICFELPYPSAPNTLRKALIAIGDCFSLCVSHDGSRVDSFSCWYGFDGPGVRFDTGADAYGRTVRACSRVRMGREGRKMMRCIKKLMTTPLLYSSDHFYSGGFSRAEFRTFSSFTQHPIIDGTIISE